MHDPNLRPANLTRAIFHMCGGVGALGVIELLGTRQMLIGASASVVVWAWTMEIGRRRLPWLNDLLMKAFAPVAHPHEREKINSATWYSTALFLIALTMPVIACEVAVVVLGFGDPVAGMVGRRFGRTRLAAGRSLEGSLAFVVAAMIAVIGALRVFHPEIGWPVNLEIAGVGAVTGALAELFARKVDDNFAIPIVSAVAAAVVLAVS